MYFDKPQDPEQEPELAAMWDFYQSQKGKLHDLELFKQFHALHQDQVVRPRREQNLPVIEWSADMIMVHFRRHRLDRRAMWIAELRRVDMMIEELSCTMLKKSAATGVREPNAKGWKLYIDMLKAKTELMRVDPDKFPGVD